MSKTDHNAQAVPAVGPRLDGGVRPWGWHARDGGAAYPAPNVEAWPDRNRKRFIEPVYSHAALLEAVHVAVAAERERWRTLLFGPHIYNGECPTPDSDQINWRDAECPACRALGAWKA